MLSSLRSSARFGLVLAGVMGVFGYLTPTARAQGPSLTPAPAPVPAPAAVQTETVEAAVERVRRLLPPHGSGFTPERADELARAIRAVDQAVAESAAREVATADQVFETLRRLGAAKRQVDEMARAVLDRRFQIAALPADENRRQTIRSFLRVNSDLIDLTGRVNYELRYTIMGAAYAFANRPDLRERLIDRLAADESTIGTALMTPVLIDPPANSPNQAQPAPPAVKRKVLGMLARHGRAEMLPLLVRFLETQPAADLALLAADAVCRVGLPQSVPPGKKVPEEDVPVITPRELLEIVQKIDTARLSPALQQHRTALLGWIQARASKGIGTGGYGVNNTTLQPGDWLLMRNSSPYNRFTDLSPGLFTHVGVVAEQRGEDGIDRLVLVDVTERQPRVRGDNLETMLSFPLYYAVLRHDDPEVGRRMSDVAASLVGNPLEFDLTFDTSRVTELKGRPLENQKVHTYCAGLLLLCAQETGLPRSEFFPIPEGPGSERLSANLTRLGMRIGDDFISPTGPLFARRMTLVHLSEPMHDPGREVEQRIYDHFARRLEREELAPRANLFQTLRQELADASKDNPVLAQALATLAGVHPETDLAAAARAVTVVETLDQIAERNSDEYRDALAALERGPLDERARAALSQEEIAEIQKQHARHAELVQRLQQGQLTRRGLNEALVVHYVERGRRQIDERFFPNATSER